MNYTIFSICTENYKDAYDFAIDSWLNNTKAHKIIIYSDIEWEPKDPRIKIEKIFSQSSDWGTNICRKSKASLEALNEGDNLVFVDMDCYIRGDIGHVFRNGFDLAVTKLERKGNVSTGIYFFRNNPKTNKFMNIWENTVKTLNGFGSRKSRPKDQVTFSSTIDKMARAMTISNLDYCRYNRKITDIKRTKEQLRNLKADNSLVLHFYNKSYNSSRNIDEVFGILSRSI